MTNYKQPLEPEATYHIYNETNGGELMFKEKKNYHFFLKKYVEHVSSVVDTYCYCLMPTHFHLLVKIKSEEELNKAYFLKEEAKRLKKNPFPQSSESSELSEGCGNYPLFVSRQFSNFFNSYAQAFNKTYHRRGSLFRSKFNRKRVSDERYFKELVFYIHQNPVKAGLVNKMKNWEHSSYRGLIESPSTFEAKKELISSFDDIENFIFFHEEKQSMTKKINGFTDTTSQK